VHTIKTERNGTMKTTTRMMTMVVFAVGLLGIHNALAQSDHDAKTVETIGGKVCPFKKPLLKKDEVTGLM
jgi:hypothetical protein